MTTLFVIAAVMLLLLAVQVTLTHVTARLVGATNATWRRAVAVVSLLTAWSLLCVPVFQVFEKLDDDQLFTAAIPLIGVCLLVIFLIYRRAYRLQGIQLLGFVVMHVVLIACDFAILLPTKWYAFEAFKVPTNSMAPTVVGRRIETTCRHCGGLVVTTEDEDPFARPNHDPGACVRCGKEATPDDIHGRILSGDRLIAAKWYEPRRWDVVAFHYPPEPATIYLKRIVGLPGEEVVIGDDGVLVVDGKRLEPPAAISWLHYTLFSGDPSSRALDGDPLWGDPRRPMKLADDEFFMLGDHTYRALDSRFWGPVKREAVVGTMTLIYWPPSRWRVFK